MKYNRASVADTVRVGQIQSARYARPIYAVATYYGMKLEWHKPANFQAYITIAPDGKITENPLSLNPGLIGGNCTA